MIAEGVAAQATPRNSPGAVEATIQLDGTQYSLLARTLAVDSIMSLAGGDRTMLIINGIGGNLVSGATTLGKMNGLLFNDTEQGISFSVTEEAHLSEVLNSNYPRSTPHFSSIGPAGPSGWLKIWSQLTDIALAGVRLSSNPAHGSYGDGINLYKLTVAPVSLTVPIVIPNCQ